MDRTEQDTSKARVQDLNTKGAEAMDEWEKDTEKARALMKNVVRECIDSLGLDNPYTWFCMNNLAWMYDSLAGQLRNEIELAMEKRGTGKSG
jgi:hypothetical protein